jgi:predicted MPP superfamily phosphohydrolase
MVYSRFAAILAFSTLLDAVVLGAVLFFPRRSRRCEGHAPPQDLRRLLQSLVAMTVVFTIKLPLCRWLGFNFFGVVYLLYLDLFVVLPLGGLTLLAAALLSRRSNPGRRVSTCVCAAAAAAVLLAPLGAYATYVEPRDLRLETSAVAVPAQRAGSSPIRIGILADIQTDCVTDYELTAAHRLMAQRPDIVLLPGDLFQGTWREFYAQIPALRDLLSHLAAPAGVYIVLGDVDDRYQLSTLVAGTPAKLLINQTVELNIGDRRVRIGGVELDPRTPAARETIRQLEAAPGDEEICILLSHRPDAVFEMSDHSRIDVVISGHTHGGQVVIPWFGPPVTLSTVPRDVARGGLHELNGNRVYVSRGVGSERGQAPMLRLNCPPEITLLELGRRR